MMALRSKTLSLSSGYLSFRFPAAVNTDFTARIPEEQQREREIEKEREREREREIEGGREGGREGERERERMSNCVPTP